MLRGLMPAPMHRSPYQTSAAHRQILFDGGNDRSVLRVHDKRTRHGKRCEKSGQNKLLCCYSCFRQQCSVVLSSIPDCSQCFTAFPNYKCGVNLHHSDCVSSKVINYHVQFANSGDVGTTSVGIFHPRIYHRYICHQSACISPCPIITHLEFTQRGSAAQLAEDQKAWPMPESSLARE